MALTLKTMEYFTAALRHGSIAKAAAELNIAASAVSTAINQVEAEFDLTLVTRQRARGIQANANGRKVARKCARLLEDYRAVLTEGAELKQALSGTLRIGYYAPIAPAFLPQILDSFLPTDTSVVLELEECDNNQAQHGLLKGVYDVIMFVAVDVWPAVTYDTLIDAPPYCLVSVRHPFAEQASVSIAEIAQEPLVVLNRPVAAPYYYNLFGIGPRPHQITTYATSTEMVRSLVAAGRGCAILSMQPMTAESYTGQKVTAVPISDVLPPLTLAIGYDQSRPRQIVQAFVQACKEHFEKSGTGQCIVRS